jgi:hypothetical protein
MRKKSALCAALIFGLTAGSPVFAGMAVLDTANLAAKLKELVASFQTMYQMYEQVTQAIKTAENTATQLKHQVDSLKRIDFSDIGKEAKDFFSNPQNLLDIEAQHRFLEDAISSLDTNLQYITDIRNTLSNRKVRFAGKDITIASLTGHGRDGEVTLLGLPKVVGDYMAEQGNAVAQAWTGQLTESQYQSIMRQYGMSAENYATMTIASSAVNDIVKETFGYGKQMIDLATQKALLNQKTMKDELERAYQGGQDSADPAASLPAMLRALGSALADVAFQTELMNDKMNQTLALSGAEHEEKKSQEKGENDRRAAQRAREAELGQQAVEADKTKYGRNSSSSWRWQ